MNQGVEQEIKKSTRSHYAKYIEEREGNYVLEDENGFATYSIGEDYIYIIDIYVVPEMRGKYRASSYADTVAAIAQNSGKRKLLGSVDTTTNTADLGMKALLGYGFKPLSTDGNLVYFIKEL